MGQEVGGGYPVQRPSPSAAIRAGHSLGGGADTPDWEPLTYSTATHENSCPMGVLCRLNEVRNTMHLTQCLDYVSLERGLRASLVNCNFSHSCIL